MRRNRPREEFLAAHKGTGGGPSPEKLKGPEELYAELQQFVAGLSSPATQEIFADRLADVWNQIEHNAAGEVVMNDRVIPLVDLHYDWVMKGAMDDVVREQLWGIIGAKIKRYSQELRAAFDARGGAPDMIPEHRRIYERYTKLCREYGVNFEADPHHSPIMKFLRDEGWLPTED